MWCFDIDFLTNFSYPSQLSSNPDWLKYALNYTGDGRNIDGYMEQAYQQGRAWLASNIRQLADPKDPARADHLEEQAKLVNVVNWRIKN